MAQERIEIQFKPKGDQALINAIKQLDRVTKRLQGTTSVYEKELKKLELRQKKTNKGMLDITNSGRLLGNSFATLRSKLLLASFAAGIFASTLGKLGKLYGFQEAAEKRLSIALGKNIDLLKAYAVQVQKTTAFGDEEVITAMALIANYTTSEKVVKQLMDATLDLAAAKGKDLSEAAEMVSKSVFSSTNALQREGIAIEGTSGSVERLTSLTTNIAALYSGQATGATLTYNGAIKDLQDSLGDLGENIGEVLVPAILTLSRMLQTLAEYFDVQKIKNYATAIVALGSSYLILTKSIKTAAKASIAFIKANKMVALAIAAVVAIAEIADRVFNVFGSDTKDLEDAINSLNTEIEDMGIKFDNAKTKAQSLKDINALLISGIQIHYKELGILKSVQEKRDILDQKQRYAQELFKEGLIDQIQLEVMLNNLKLEGMDIDNQETQQKIENIQQIIQAVSSVASAYEKMKLQGIENDRQTELSAAGNIKWETKRQKQIERINDKYNKKAKEQKEEMRDIKIAEAISNTALGITKSFSDPGGIAGWIMAGLIAVQGAMQVATIKAQKYQYGGMVGGNRHSQGGTMIEAERGEYVISRQGVESAGIEALNRINAGAGAGSVNISFNGNVLSKDFIEDEAIPQIKEAIRRGADIGVG